ncbi:hypothetical protein BSKO_02001 [Bryopsis sp. KO-2023]|nr:hypothetical protein BSKO_02001 [Bryopsis sp. KO-2023]
MSTNANYHFLDKTASTFNLLVVAHLGFAVFTSIFDSDVSASIAVMGIVSVLSASVPLLLLYLIFSPVSILVDIIRLSTMKHHGAFGFFVFLKVLEWLAKGGAVFFGYQVYTSASSGGDNAGAYEQINNGAQGQPTQSFQAPDPFNPSTYTAPPPPPAPIETGTNQPM